MSRGKLLILFVPGRIGTSSPELSYGSHIFQDLVEAGILYNAVFENEKTLVFAPEKIRMLENRLTEFYPEGEPLKNIIGIYSVSDRQSYVYHDMKEEHLLCVL